MRTVMLVAWLLIALSYANAQDLLPIREKIEKGKYTEAKADIDLLLKDPKAGSIPDAWLYKAQIYAELTKANLKDAALTAGAFEAINRYVALEAPKAEANRFLTSKLQGHRTFFDVYTVQFKYGADAFNRKDFTTALAGFSRSADMFGLLSKYNMTNVKNDTTSLLYAGVAAESARMPEEAVKYYTQVAALKIPDTTHMGIYGYLINYYTGKKDFAAANKYIDAAESLFPNRDTWMSFRIEQGGQDSLNRLKKYEELMVRYPNQRTLVNDYAVELYRYVYFNDKRAGDTAWVNKLRDAYRGAARVNPTPINNYVMMSILGDDVNYYLNNINRLKNSTNPAEVKRREAFQTLLDKANEEMLQYALKTADAYSTLPNLKTSDKANYKRALNNIIDYYTAKNQKEKLAPYQQKLQALN